MSKSLTVGSPFSNLTWDVCSEGRCADRAREAVNIQTNKQGLCVFRWSLDPLLIDHGGEEPLALIADLTSKPAVVDRRSSIIKRAVHISWTCSMQAMPRPSQVQAERQ